MVSAQNDFLFGSNGKEVASMFPVVITTRQQAYRTAAWIKLMGSVLPNDGPDTSEYDEIEQAIANS
jgi:hypothetical protein